MDFLFPLKENFNNLLFNSLIKERSFGICLTYQVVHCQKDGNFKEYFQTYYETFNQTLLKVSPSKKTFHIGGGVLQGWINDQITPGGEFHKCVLQYVDTATMKIFPNHSGCTLVDKTLASLYKYERIYLQG